MQLQQSPFLSLVSDERIRRTLPLMNQPADARLTPDIARAVCVRTASAAVLEGSIAALGSQYVLGLRANQLRDWRHPCRRAGTGGTKRRCPEHAQSDCHAFPNASWRIARHHRETLEAARGSDDAVARSAAGLQRRIEGHSLRHGACRFFNVRSRSIPSLRWPMRSSGSATASWESRRWRDRACSRPTSCAIGPATSSASTSKHCTTATSRAIWNGSNGHWKRGPRAIRAMPSPHTLLAGLALIEHRPT